MQESESTNDCMRLIGEPTTRPDGKIVTLYEFPTESRVTMDIDGTLSLYEKQEILHLGEGNYTNGLIYVGKAGLNLPASAIGAGRGRLLNNELNTVQIV